MNDNVKRMISEIPEEVKQNTREYVNRLIKQNDNTSDSDIKEMLEYMDKLGIEYTIDRNPTQEKIDRIKEQIKKNEEIRGIK